MSRASMAALVAVLMVHGATGASAQQPAKAPAKANCITKAGEATGITRAFAEYEALLIIRQVTGNWPIETDRIGPVTYSCRQGGGAPWTCKAVAKVCRS